MNKFVIENDLFFNNVTGLLKEGRTVTIPVKGWSMLPFIRPEKDTVTLCGAASYTPEGKEEVSPAAGDIVLFRYHGRFIMHRILEVRPDGIYRIQGDGVPKNEETCRYQDICGKVITINRNGTVPIDPYSKKMMRRLSFWNIFKPFRRYFSYAYRLSEKLSR